ncbi:hypothetical protein [Streptomyces sp. NPDC002746]
MNGLGVGQWLAVQQGGWERLSGGQRERLSSSASGRPKGRLLTPMMSSFGRITDS